MAIQIHRMGIGANPIRAPIQDGICIHKWSVDDKEIRLLQIGNDLQYIVHDKTERRSWRVDILPDELPLEERIAYLKKCEVVLNFDGSVDFCEPLKKYPIGNNREITLLYSSGDLIWQLFNRTTNISTQITCTFRRDLPLEGRISIIKNHKIDKLQIVGTQIQFISLKPITFSSHMDHTKSVDGNVWAVTLITCGDYESSEPFTIAGHAALIFERVFEGSYEMIKTDLVLGGRIGKYHTGKVNIHHLQKQLFLKNNELWIRYKDSNSEEVTECKLYKRKAQTWMRSSATIQTLLDVISKEKRDPIPCLFNPLGSGSIGAPRKIYVNGEGIKEIPSDLASHLEYFHTGVTDGVKFFSDNFPLIGKTWRKEIIAPLLGINTQKGPSIELERNTRKISETRALSEDRFLMWYIELQRRYGKENVSIIESENCISWARKKMLKIGINPPENLFSELLSQAYGNIITLPKAFTRKD